MIAGFWFQIIMLNIDLMVSSSFTEDTKKVQDSFDYLIFLDILFSFSLINIFVDNLC